MTGTGTTMTTLAAAVGRTLAANGIHDAFGVVGNGNVYAVDALIANGVRYVAARHEGGAMAMADAYYRATGEIAICTTTYGPGLTNLATGLAEAAKHSSGALVLCGDAPAHRPPRPADIDQTGFVTALGVPVVRLTDPRTALAETAAAVRLARTSQAPVVLFLPDDLLKTEVADEPAVADAESADRPAPARTELEAATDVLAGARRPLVLAGLGAWRSGAREALIELTDELGGLVATTVMANGMFTGYPWSVGICGGFSAPAAARLIGEADVVVVFGASLGTFTLHGGKLLAQGAKVVQVDIAKPPTSPRTDLGITGDAREVAAALLTELRIRQPRRSRWRAEAGPDVGRAQWTRTPHADAGTAERIDPRTLAAALAGLLPEERTLVTDGGHFVGWPIMYWPVPDPAGLVFTGASFMGIGLGFGGAVGAAAGRPDRTTVVALGDGGALMGLPDLETLIRVATSAVVVVFDDGAYGWEVHVYGEDTTDLGTMSFGDTDFAAVSRALGATAVTVRSVADLAAVRTWRDGGARGTLVLDCKVVPEVMADYLAELRHRLRAG